MDRLRSMIATHEGVFTAAQAAAHGVDSDGARRRVANGEWVRVVRGVYRTADRHVDDRRRMRIAVLSAGPGAALASAAAAWWHGLTANAPDIPTTIAPHGRHGSEVAGTRVWHRTVDATDLMIVDGLRVTAVPLTVLDASVDIGVRVMDSALLQGRVAITDLVVAQRRNKGRVGSPRSRMMLSAMSSGARSVAERQAVTLLRSSELSGWSTNVPACGYLLDLAFPDLKLAIEIDGFAFHSDAEAFQRDRERQNVLIANGWTVLRFTWHDLTTRPAWVLTQIRRLATPNP